MLVTLEPITIKKQAVFLDFAQKSEDLFIEFGGGPITEADAEQLFADLLAKNTATNQFSFFIIVDGQPAGFVDVADACPRKNMWQIWLMFVAPEFRGKGVGRRAFALISNYARKHGAQKLRLVTAKDNEQSLKFWQKNAFVITRYLEDYHIKNVSVPTYQLEKEVWVDVFVG